MFLKTFLSILAFASFSISSLTFAEYLNFFSPRDDVNFHINRAINGASQSIDITVGDIKSKEIADALVLAAKRSVSIRILFSKKSEINSESKIKYLLENGINAWILEDSSVNLNNFIIFDKKLLLLGSFSMNQDDYQSITFTDDQDSLQQYQVRFEGFASLKLLPAKDMFSKQSSQSPGSAEQRKGNLPAFDSKLPAGAEINLSYEEMYKIFGKGSTVSKSERKRLWSEYKGKYVTWTGNISYIAWGLLSGNLMGVSHPIGKKDDTVYIRDSYVNHAKRLHRGDTVVYRGRLVKRPNRFNGFKIKDAEILPQTETEIDPK